MVSALTTCPIHWGAATSQQFPPKEKDGRKAASQNALGSLTGKQTHLPGEQRPQFNVGWDGLHMSTGKRCGNTKYLGIFFFFGHKLSSLKQHIYDASQRRADFFKSSSVHWMPVTCFKNTAAEGGWLGRGHQSLRAQLTHLLSWACSRDN